MRYYVYLVINKINNKKYIGQHYGEVDDDYFGSGKLIKSAIKKYGISNFYKEILAFANSKEELNELEKHFIKVNNAILDEQFYNLAEGGEGFNISLLTKEQMLERNNKIKQTLAYLRSINEDFEKEKTKKFIEMAKNPEIIAKRIKTLKENLSKKTPEEIKNNYKSRSGSKAYQAKPVITPRGRYETASEAAKDFNVSIQTVLNRCKNDKFKDWKFDV